MRWARIEILLSFREIVDACEFFLVGSSNFSTSVCTTVFGSVELSSDVTLKVAPDRVGLEPDTALSCEVTLIAVDGRCAVEFVVLLSCEVIRCTVAAEVVLCCDAFRCTVETDVALSCEFIRCMVETEVVPFWEVILIAVSGLCGIERGGDAGATCFSGSDGD